MEENIEYLKKLTKPPLREEWDFAYKLDKTTAQAIENLIKGYREKEDKIIKYEKTLEKLQKDTIWKSKIKEKIEELENESYQISLNSEIVFDSEIMKNNLKIMVLQELLEEE